MEKNQLPKHHSQPSCSHCSTIYDSQLQKAIVFRTQPQQRGTLTQPFHCDLQTRACKTQWHSVKKKRESTLNPQLHRARKANRNRRRSDDGSTRRAREPTFLCNGTCADLKKTQCFVQILTFKSHPWCSHSNAICQQRRAKHNHNRNTVLKKQVPLEKPSHSHATAICIDWIAQHNSTASTKKRKSRLEPSVTLRTKIQQEPAAKRRRPHTEPPFTRQNTMFRANPNLQIAFMMYLFQRDLPTRTCKTQAGSQLLSSTRLSTVLFSTLR